MAQLPQGQRLTLPITATQGYYFSTSGAAIVRVTPSNGGAFVVTIGTNETDIGWFGFDASLELIAQSGVLTYNTTPSALTAVQLGDQRDSDAVDVALMSQGMLNGSTAFDAITLAGLPNTTGAPEGYGDLASALNSAGVDTDPVRRLIPVDYCDITVLQRIGRKMIGTQGQTNKVFSWDVDSKVSAQWGSDLPVGKDVRFLTVIDDQTVLATIDGGDLLLKQYRTTDAGATWQETNYDPVYPWIGANHSNAICSTDDGILYFAEYNVATGRVPGQGNDRVRLLKSVDNGFNWTEVTRWNTDGNATNVRHLHGVYFNPYNRKIYVTSGDSDSQCAIFCWDGVSDWPINTSPGDIVNSSGLSAISGLQRFRAIDVIFKDDGFIYWVPDAPTSESFNESEAGAWKVNYSLDKDTLYKISTASSEIYGTAGRFGVMTETGEQVWLCGNESAIDGYRYSTVVVSNKASTDFKAVARFNGLASETYYVRQGVVAFEGRVYVSVSRGAGKQDSSTAVVEFGEKFIGAFKTHYEMDIIHPVYWVDQQAGDNANSGWNPRLPWATLSHALTSSRVPYGARIALVNEVFTEAGVITPNQSASDRQGDFNDYVYITGAGATKTRLQLGAGAAIQLIQASSTIPMRIAVADLYYLNSNPLSGCTLLTTQSGAVGAGGGFKAIRCAFNELAPYLATGRSDRVVVAVGISCKFYSCVIVSSKDQATSSCAVETNTSATLAGDFFFDSCVMDSGRGLVRVRNANCKIVGINNIILGGTPNAFRFESGSSFAEFSFRDSKFASLSATAKLVENLAGLSFSNNIKGSQIRWLTLGETTALDSSNVYSDNGPMPSYSVADYLY